jgi:hypothetical protein
MTEDYTIKNIRKKNIAWTGLGSDFARSTLAKAEICAE